MDSPNGKKKSDPSIKVVQDASSDAVYSVDDKLLPPELRNLPVFPTDDIVLFPGAFLSATIRKKVQINAVIRAMREKEHVVILPIKNPLAKKSASPEDLHGYYSVGTHARIIKISRLDEQGTAWQVSMRGIQRVEPQGIEHDSAFDILRVRSNTVTETNLAIIGQEVYEDQNLFRTLKQYARKFFEHQPAEEYKDIMRITEQARDAGVLTDFLAAQIDMPFEERAALLCELEIRSRLQLLLRVLANQFEVAKIVADTAQKVRTDLDRQQRDYFIRQHIKALKTQVNDDNESDAEELKAQIESLDADQTVIDYALKQWKRLSYMPQSSAEYSAARSHIEALLDIPWRKMTEDHINLHDARVILDQDHYGLEEVKKRVLEYLAVIALKHDLKAPILCLVGPPGVGKTSIGKSIARALGRRFDRISLGGIHDESEIRGHRRTYVASMPGRIVQALRRTQSLNPVIILDEIDKLTSDMHGDPSSALLEVLDPEQNSAFVDNYIETPIDLSHVMFMTTANTLETIPQPLRDRMEIIEISGYTQYDKEQIAQAFLIPKLLKMHGLLKSNLTISPEAIASIVANYTREAGVRQLEQRLAAVCRKTAAKVVEGKEEGKKHTRVSIVPKKLEAFLGREKYESETIEKSRLPGIATGMAWTQYGGDILYIETTDMPGKGGLVLTGKLGDVMQESMKAAYTLLRSRAESLGISAETFETHDVHVHVPAGATPKDGPSAGVAIFCALLSLFKSISIPTAISMTGEISLRGNVLPVGGIREKVLAAHRAGIRTIILPERNIRDTEDVPESVRSSLEFVPISTIDEAIDFIFKDIKKV